MGVMVSSRESVAWPERREDRRDAGTKPIDFTYLGRFTFGNRELEREVLYLFAQHAPMYLASLKTAETSKAWHDAAHTLKGSARAVGAVRVVQPARPARTPAPSSIARRSTSRMGADASGERDAARGFGTRVYTSTRAVRVRWSSSAGQFSGATGARTRDQRIMSPRL